MVGVGDVATIATSEYSWALVFLWLLYQVYWPEDLHPSKPKLRRLFADDPRLQRLIVAICDLAELSPKMDHQSLKEDLDINEQTYITDATPDGGVIRDEDSE